MRIPDELRECVCFVEARWPSGAAEVGTAFFVGVPLDAPPGSGQSWFHYVVSARHCIAGRKETQEQQGGPAETAALLINQRGGGRVRCPTRVADWLLHGTADVAVLPIGTVNPVFEVSVWDADKSVANDKIVRERDIGAGDDVFIAGLLIHHPGKTRNLPIVRLGSVAAMPEDPVERMETGPDVVTLVQVHSIGGLSGSPVFVHLSLLRDIPEGANIIRGGSKAGSGGTSWLHGVMHGFYPVGKDDPDNVSGGDESLNTGIAIVARIDRVLDLIHRPDQIALRDEVKKRIEDEDKSTIVPTASEAGPYQEFESFEALTRDLLRVPKGELERDGDPSADQG